jgi:hypothetical protein
VNHALSRSYFPINGMVLVSKWNGLMLGHASIIRILIFPLSLAMPWFLLEWWVCEWIFVYSFRVFYMFLTDLDFVINYDGYFQALILHLEVGEDLVLRSSMSGERDERALHADEEAKEERFFITQWCFEGLDSQEDMLKRFGPLDSETIWPTG